MARKVEIGIGIIGIGIAFLPYILEHIGLKLSQPLLYFLFILAGSMMLGGFIFALWDVFKRLASIRIRSPIFLKSATFTNNLKIQSAKTYLLSNGEAQELLDFYERQKASWKSYIRLNLVRVIPNMTADSPKVTFELEVINYLPVNFKLIKVIHSSVVVSAGIDGSRNLPSLPETIDEKINQCNEKQFKIEVGCQ